MAKGLNRKNRGQRRNANIIEQPITVKPKKYLEKRVRVYIVADPESGQYLYKKPGYDQYHFFKDVSKSTKTEDRSMAQFLIECYHSDTQDFIDLVVIPLEITYELINESDNTNYEEEIVKEISQWNKKKLN